MIGNNNLDTGIACSFEASTAIEDELMTKIKKYGKEAHGLDPIPTDVAQKIKIS
jgi:predicted small metal-binding protein